jgi:hypothetical protein
MATSTNPIHGTRYSLGRTGQNLYNPTQQRLREAKRLDWERKMQEERERLEQQDSLARLTEEERKEIIEAVSNSIAKSSRS